MNCANHADASAVAFCRTCGKPLCANCTRDVRGVIYCEACLAARMESAMPAPPQAAFVPPASTPAAAVPVRPASPYASAGPNPTVAGILAGFFPLGVGAVYNSQYAKGLAHLLIFLGLTVGHNFVRSGPAHAVMGIALGFFYFYQIIDAVRSAKAIQAGLPAPDPFGLAQTFSTGQRVESSKIPAGAIVLIVLGIAFMMDNSGLVFFGFWEVLAVLLIGMGLWIFARRWGLIGQAPETCNCDRCRTKCITGPAILVTVGILLLLHSLDVPHADFANTWPVILLVIGLTKLAQTNASMAGHKPRLTTPLAGASSATAVSSSQVPPPPPSEVNHG
jgi:hypothetical protein